MPWKCTSDEKWRESLKSGRCIVGCNLEQNGLVCMHLQSYLLRGGMIKPWFNLDYMPMETHISMSAPNEPKEVEFRKFLSPFVNEAGHSIPGHITPFEADILVLRFVYDLTYKVMAKELDSDTKTLRLHLNKALATLKHHFPRS